MSIGQTDNDLISIILPTRNRENHLAAAIASVRRQTYTAWELIVVDDASDDNTDQVVKEFMGQEQRIRYIRLRQNLGGGQARNAGLDAAKGSYVAFLDDDDSWHPEKLAVQKEFLDTNPDVAIVSCGFRRIRDHRVETVTRHKSVTLDDLKLETTLGSFTFCMVRTPDLASCRIDPQLRACQDWDLWYKILKTSGKRAEIIPDCLADYDRTEKNSITWHLTQALRARIYFLRRIWPDLSHGQQIYHLFALALRRAVASNRRIRIITWMLSPRYLYETLRMIRAVGIRPVMDLAKSQLPKACRITLRRSKLPA